MESHWSSNCTNATFATNSFHLCSFSPTNALLNVMFSGADLKTWAIYMCFFLAMLYKDEYSSLRVKFPNHLSSQNLICSPLWILKVEDSRKWTLAFIRPDQKCESPGFQVPTVTPQVFN
jgi:hypothetical protein